MRFQIRRDSIRFFGIRIVMLMVLGLVCTGFSETAFGQQAVYSEAGFRGTTPAAPVRRVAPVVTQNFIIHAADPQMAQKVAREAERFRKELAIEWLGHELEPWAEKCPITVEIGRHAGGETSFQFDMPHGAQRGTPGLWKMRIFGPPDRLLDAVLPHEVTHTIFASHFGQPLPRWADEGACTTVEHVSERSKNHRMLIEFLTARPSRGISFNRMFTMKEYPNDILPLYAQGYSLARFLILQKGRQHFLGFVGKGLQSETQGPALRAWDSATNEFYGYRDLSDLYLNWIDWVKKGSSESAFQQVAATPTANASPPTRLARAEQAGFIRSTAEPMSTTFAKANSGSWYARQMSQPAGQTSPSNQPNPPTTNPPTTNARKASTGGQSDNDFENNSLPVIRHAASGTIWR